ncbi:MAG: hypothetical protein ACKO0Z_08590 [Betaproteobacteria bacterium]
MKLHLTTKNTPFALDVTFDGSVLSFRIRNVMQREFVGDPSKEHQSGGKFFDDSLITDWRGDWGVFEEGAYERSLDLAALKSHAEFGDHASFMLYAPKGWASEGVRESLFDHTPNLYVATLASKMDAQAYHATVVQAHPIGHILVPFKTSDIADWLIGFNVFDPELVKTEGDLQSEPCVTLALARMESLPVVRFMPSVESDEGLMIHFRLETPDGQPIASHDAEVYLDSTAGFLRDRRVMTVNGEGSTVFKADGLSSGTQVKIKVGFKHFSGTDDLVVNVP